MIAAGELGTVYSVCGSYVQDWLFLDTDYNWRVLAEEGGELRAVADIGTHWLDLVHAITGLEVEAVCADLSTVHPVRQRPMGEVETFSGKQEKAADQDGADQDHHRGLRLHPAALRGRGPGLPVGLAGDGGAEELPAVRDRRLEAAPWPGTASSRTRCGSAIATRPNESLIRDPSLVSGPAARRFINYPGGHNEGFPDTFKQCFRAFYDYIAAGRLLGARRRSPRSPTAIARFVLCEAILQEPPQGPLGRGPVKGERP